MKEIITITYETMHDGVERQSSIEADNTQKAIEELMSMICKRMKLAPSIHITNIIIEGGNTNEK